MLSFCSLAEEMVSEFPSKVILKSFLSFPGVATLTPKCPVVSLIYTDDSMVVVLEELLFYRLKSSRPKMSLKNKRGKS